MPSIYDIYSQSGSLKLSGNIKKSIINLKKYKPQNIHQTPQKIFFLNFLCRNPKINIEKDIKRIDIRKGMEISLFSTPIKSDKDEIAGYPAIDNEIRIAPQNDSF